MEYKLIIENRLPSLNEYQYACRSHFSKGAQLKKQWIMIVSAYINQQLRGVKINNKVIIEYKWYEPNRKRDLDNITGFGKKVIQDALVENEVLKNDGWEHILGFTDTFYIDKENPRVEITIIEVED